MKTLTKLALLFLFFALPACAQTPPQLDMFGNLTGVACPASASWINTTVSSGAITGSTTAQNISLTSITGVAAGNWLAIDAGAAPVQVTGEALGTVATGTTQYKVTLAHGNYLPGTAVLKVNGVIVAYDQGAKTTPALAGQLQTGILTDAGLVTTGTSSGFMAAATGGATDATAYPNFMSVQNADPVAPGGGVADQEFINVVLAAGFDTAHNGQAITMDYKYSPAEFFVVPSLTGSQLNSVVLLNSHTANAIITQGTWYTAKVTVGTTPTWVFCDPLGFGNQQFALYAIGQDGTSSHMSKTANTTVAAAVTVIGSQTVTPASMAGICLNCYLTIDQGTSSEETEQVTAVTGTTFTMNFTKTHAASFTAKGYYYNGVAFGTCTAQGGCNGGLAGTSGGKYFGNIAFQGPMQIIRARGWGYNMVQGFFDNRAAPVETVTGGGTIPWPTADHSNIAKMPFIITNDAVQQSSDAALTLANTAGCGGGVAGANGDTDFNTKDVWTTFNGVVTGGAGTQGISPYQYVNQYCGDKPSIGWAGRPADPDSVMNIVGGSSPIDVATQALRATKYGSWITQLGVKGTTTNTDTFTGINTWQFEDNYSESTNWGLVSAEDNPYDGVHDTTSGTPEMVGNNALAYTPELHNYGDFINPVRIDIVNQENSLLGAAPPPVIPTVPTGKQPMLAGRERKSDGTVVLGGGNR